MIKTDKNGMLIGDGSWHADYSIEDMTGYPVTISVEKALTTESVYVNYKYSDLENEVFKTVSVRWSSHRANENYTGMYIKINGRSNQRDEILNLLGLKKSRIVDVRAPYFKNHYVSKKKINEYTMCDMTFDELLALPVGTKIPKGQVCRKGDLLCQIDSDEIYLGKIGERIEYYD